MPLLGFPHCQPLRAIDWLTGCSFGTFHLPLIPWLPDGPLFLSRPALPLRSTAILKYCKKENRIFFSTPGRPVGTFPLTSCQFFVSASGFQGQRALPQSTFSFSYNLAMEDQSGLTWQRSGRVEATPLAHCHLSCSWGGMWERETGESARRATRLCYPRQGCVIQVCALTSCAWRQLGDVSHHILNVHPLYSFC